MANGDPRAPDPSRSRTRSVAVILVAGALIGLATAPRYIADASVYVCMTESLIHDRDLRWEREDFERARTLDAEPVPAGLLLVETGDRRYFAKPPLYPLVAAPFVAVAGLRGFSLLNGILLAALIVLGAEILSRHLRWPLAVGASAVAIGASVTPAYLHWVDPFLLLSTLVAAAVVAWAHERPALCGALIAAAAATRFPYGALVLAPVGLYVAGHRWRMLAGFALGGALSGLALLLTIYAGTGRWSPYTGERFYYARAVPHELPEMVGRKYSREAILEGWRPPAARDLLRGASELVVGRFAGLLLYFPALFACLVWMRRLDRDKIAWLLALATSCMAVLVLIPHHRIGGTYALGNRHFVLLPVALVVVDDLGWRPLRLLVTGALLALAVPLVSGGLYYSLHPGLQTIEAPYRWFPVEWRSAMELSYPFALSDMSALDANQWGAEAGGAWTRGGRRAEFVLIRPAGVPVAVDLWSLLPAARVGDGNEVRELRFVPFVHQTVPLTHPMTLIRDEYEGYAEFAVYRLTIETDTAVRPIDVGVGQDRRALGVFVKALP